jgi:hypothetical protein
MTWVSFLQLSSLAAEQELYNIQKECAEKDAIIKELTAAAHTSNNADAKVRIIAMLACCFADGISLQHYISLFASRESQSCRIFLKAKIW